MKKIIIFIVCIAALLSLSACADIPEALEPLPDDLSAEISSAAKEKWGDNIAVYGPYGSFDGKTVVICSGFLEPGTNRADEKIGSVNFTYEKHGYNIYVYYNSEFFSLDEAYDLKMITRSDLKEIRLYYEDHYLNLGDAEREVYVLK